MNIQEVLKLKNGTIVQDTETKERYIVFTYGRDKYLARYKYREEILHFVVWILNGLAGMKWKKSCWN